MQISEQAHFLLTRSVQSKKTAEHLVSGIMNLKKQAMAHSSKDNTKQYQ